MEVETLISVGRLNKNEGYVLFISGQGTVYCKTKKDIIEKIERNKL